MADPEDQSDDAEKVIVSIMAELRDCPREHRRAEMVAWARSRLWHPALMVAMGWQGEVARDAYRAFRQDLDADTPGRRWYACDPALGRASIIRLLGLNDCPVASYAGVPFSVWTDDDDRDWIAGAIGCSPFLDPDAAMYWSHLDIRDVLLWCPRTNEVHIAGEHQSVAAYIMPDQPLPTLKVWGNPASFFKAWAAERARVGELAVLRSQGRWAHPIHEAADSGLPGALLVGNAEEAQWPRPQVDRVVACAGVHERDLRRAALRAAGLPAFAGAAA